MPHVLVQAGIYFLPAHCFLSALILQLGTESKTADVSQTYWLRGTGQ